MESEKISEELNPSSTNLSSHASLSGNENGIGDFSMESQNLQWAQGKAGEDRDVVSDEHGWVFVGIYDGFNGPDAPNYLLSNLYSAVHEDEVGCIDGVDKENCTVENVLSKHLRNESNEMDNKWEESQRRIGSFTPIYTATNPSDVLKALSEALGKTEEAYLDVANKVVTENPKLALMGSCVLVMLMKGDDVYLMNIGDSSAVLAQKVDPKIKQNFEWINKETLCKRRSSSADELYSLNNLTSVLTIDHSTNVKEVF
ncbi:probable protein phosphatase 2C 23 [Rosa chinensis]|uniref:probable protein phosphatase 2C 23 n=1 Tax=Rosa chinensis TaxID=74649 RepID=UPI000D096028|nr:probable protein phosphatase 2C 23 [Rosa chinensis]